MLAWEHGGFSIDASVRTTIFRLQLRVYCQPLEHLLRCCGGPPFAMERLSVIRGDDGRIACIRSVLPRHKAANWVGPGRSRKSTQPGTRGVVELSLFGNRETGARGSGAAHQPGTCGGSAMGLATPDCPKNIDCLE